MCCPPGGRGGHFHSRRCLLLSGLGQALLGAGEGSGHGRCTDGARCLMERGERQHFGGRPARSEPQLFHLPAFDLD